MAEPWKLRDLANGEFFTLKPLLNPKDRQVFQRCEYDRSQRKYWCQRMDDISEGKYLSGDHPVYTEFTW